MKSLIKSVSRSQFPPHLNISDVLLLHDEEEEALILSLKGSGMGRGGGVFECASPRRIVERLVGGLRRRRNREAENEIDGQSKRGSEEVESVDVRDSSSSAPAMNDATPERCGREFSFNLGVGGCLLYLIAASRSELDKMMELRAEMEKIVEKAKQESQRKDEIPSTPETHEIFTYSAESNRRRSLQISNLTSDMVQSENPVEAAEGMKQLEAELEVELERLQLCLDTENLNNPIQETLNVIDEENGSARSSSFSSSEVINRRNETEIYSDQAQFEVSPIELERRLHELLEARQQEQIRELEAALELANNKLREKEAEIFWWKDTTRIFFRYVSEPPRPFRNFE